jgi:hypothetical protein
VGGTVVVMGLRWWLDVVMRRGNGGVVVVRWCGENGAGLFIAGARSVRGRFLWRGGRRRAALGVGRARSPGDGTARAGAEVVEQLLSLFKHVAQGW